jgi:hypothetical protein
LEERQLFAKEKVFCNQTAVARATRKTSRTTSNTTKDKIRMQCATARKTDERNMNAQDYTLQRVMLPEFRLGRSFCGAQVDADLSKYFDTIPHSELMQCVAQRILDGICCV